MAWIADKNPSACLKSTPSLIFNNLTSNVSSLAYIYRGSVEICDLRGEHKRTLTDGKGARALQVLLCSGKEFDFLVVALDNGVQVWSTDGARMIYFFDSAGPLASASSSTSNKYVKGVHFTQGIAFVPRGTTFVVGCSDGDVFAFDAKCGPMGEACELIATLRGHNHTVTCAGAGADFCITGDASGTIMVWSIASDDLGRRCSFDGDGNPATAICAREGLAVASFSTGHLRIYDTHERTITIEIAAHSRLINAIDLDPSGMLSIKSRGKGMRTLSREALHLGMFTSATNAEPLGIPMPHFCVGILVTVGEDMYLNVWELPERSGQDDGHQSGQQVGLLASSCVVNQLLTGVRFSVDGSQRILAAAYDCEILHTWHKL